MTAVVQQKSVLQARLLSETHDLPYSILLKTGRHVSGCSSNRKSYLMTVDSQERLRYTIYTALTKAVTGTT